MFHKRSSVINLIYSGLLQFSYTQLHNCGIKFVQFQSQIQIRTDPNQNFELELNICKETKPTLLIIEMDKIRWNIIYNIVYYHIILFMSVECLTRL
jgi:hypothetical protein